MPARPEAIYINGEPRYFAPVLGLVDSDDSAETLKLRRIRVVCPSIDPNEPLPWALPKDAVRRDWLPVKGDLVWVEFQGGFVDRPIWSGLAVAKDDVSSDFLANYVSDYRRDTDPSGNVIEWTSDQGSPTGEAILINGTKRLATEDHLAWIKVNVLDWIKTNLLAPTGWLQTHVQPPPAGVVDPASILALAGLHTAWAAIIADYETKRAAGAANLTNKVMGE